MRLDKFLADAGVGSRSEVKSIIKKKQIFVDDKCITDAGYSVKEESIVIYKGQQIKRVSNVYYMFHKPAGCVSATVDKDKTVIDYFDKALGKDLFPVGRLDKDTEGLLLITNDGKFSHALMSPKKHVSKLYYFEGEGNFQEDTIKLLTEGIDIGDDKVCKPAKISYMNTNHLDVYHGNMDTSYHSYMKQNWRKNAAISVIGLLEITEGRFHQVKRMLHKCGVEVVYLKRLAIGELFLDSTLQCGTYRELRKDEFDKLGYLID